MFPRLKARISIKYIYLYEVSWMKWHFLTYFKKINIGKNDVVYRKTLPFWFALDLKKYYEIKIKFQYLLFREIKWIYFSKPSNHKTHILTVVPFVVHLSNNGFDTFTIQCHDVVFLWYVNLKLLKLSKQNISYLSHG